jgi:hypothetical protein
MQKDPTHNPEAANGHNLWLKLAVCLQQNAWFTITLFKHPPKPK